nr:hypothetical protein CFP56_52750 [Quercus suber]
MTLNTEPVNGARKCHDCRSNWIVTDRLFLSQFQSQPSIFDEWSLRLSSGFQWRARRPGDFDTLVPIFVDAAGHVGASVARGDFGFGVGIRAHAFGAERRIEALPDRLDHLAEPVHVQTIEHQVGGEVGGREPQRDVRGAHECGALGLDAGVVETDVAGAAVAAGVVVHEDGRLAVTRLDGGVDVVEDIEGAVQAPANATAEERGGQECAVDGLVDGAREVELVAEPMDVEKGRRELVEKEYWGIEV